MFDDSPNFISDIFRSFAALFDHLVYGIMKYIYEIFFAVSSSKIVTVNMVNGIFTRVFLILTVFMAFKLTFSLLTAMVNPDNVVGKGAKGKNFIMKIVVAIVLLAVVMPLDLNNKEEATPGSFSSNIQQNGLLFGTLYQLQDVVLNQNIIGKIILSSEAGSEGTNQEIAKTADQLGVTVFGAFFSPNQDDDGNYKCVGSELENIKANYEEAETVEELLSLLNNTCKTETGKKVYAFHYFGFLSAIIGGIVVFLILSFTIDVAIRAIKLAILRLIAPVPVLGYMSQKSSDSGAFGSWVKQLSSTYIDLFIRLLIIYLAVFMVQELTKSGVAITDTGNPIVNSFVLVFIIVGIFFFAKQAPKFIKDVLGIKGGGDTFGGIGRALAPALALGGAAGSALASYRAGRDADIALGHTGGNMARRALRMTKNLAKGAAGGVIGAGIGTKAALGAKDHAIGATLKAMRERNERTLAYGQAGSTALGRMGASAHQYLTSGSTASNQQRRLTSLQNGGKRLDDLYSSFKKEATKGKYGAVTVNGAHYLGDKNVTGSSKELREQAALARSRGEDVFYFQDKFTGNVSKVYTSNAEVVASDLEKAETNKMIEDFASGDSNRYSKYERPEDYVAYTSIVKDTQDILGVGLSSRTDFEAALHAYHEQSAKIESSSKYRAAQANTKK